jgi:hypothetical protein
MGWSGIKNGLLLDLAQEAFDVFLTIDQGIPHQQNINARRIALVLMIASNNRIETLRPLAPGVLKALETIQPGELVRVSLRT